MRITQKPIDLEAFTGSSPTQDCGGSVFFVGRVRDHHEGKRVKRLFYECYQPMAEKEIQRIIDAVIAKTEVRQIDVIHRVGWLEIGEIAVAVSASGAHRAEAFEACRQVIDRIKENVPIWKKEVYSDMTHDWVVCQHNNKRSYSHDDHTEASHNVF